MGNTWRSRIGIGDRRIADHTHTLKPSPPMAHGLFAAMTMHAGGHAGTIFLE